MATDAKGARIAGIEIVSTALVASSKEVIPGTVKSPGYGHLRNIGNEVLRVDNVNHKLFGTESKESD